MRKLFSLIAQILLGILCLCLICTGYAEVSSVDLSTFSLSELTGFQADIRAENRLHHETDAEVEAGVLEAVKAGAHTITLGRRILRTETAGMTVLSILMYLLEQD